jgi:hypothetical protein
MFYQKAPVLVIWDYLVFKKTSEKTKCPNLFQKLKLFEELNYEYNYLKLFEDLNYKYKVYH